MSGLLIFGFLAILANYILFVSFRDGVTFLDLGNHLKGRNVPTKAVRPVRYWIWTAMLLGPTLAFNLVFLASAYSIFGGGGE